MLTNIPEYQVIEKIHESSNSQIYRGIRQTDNLPVILKVLNTEFPTFQVIGRYKSEYEITKDLASDLVINAYDLRRYQNGCVIVLEDFGGKSLAEILTTKKLNLGEFLTLAIQICEAVSQIHVANIIHKDLNPSNIVFNSKTAKLKIIDFGIASALTKETLVFNHNQVLEGTLDYISPEQTGRMNRSLDYRTDIYALGVTFYQMLTGCLPFASNDPLELIHYHLALEPIAPHLVDSQIPVILSQIVLKLMAKTAEGRYQSAWGIKADLEKCLEQLQTTGEIVPFALATQDIADRFLISEKLYGREQEAQSLLAAFARVTDRSDRGEMVLISGYSGIGKSSLVQEIHKPIAKSRGYFISGKFDQYQRNIPYFAIIQAFQELIKQLLTESTESLDKWRSQILAALGSNSAIVAQVIPSLELIIGKQVQQSAASNVASEGQNRFNRVFQKLIQVFTQSEPLVIFLDDLQWADRASLKLLEILATNSESQSLLLIGAYRDNEVNASHPVVSMITNIQQKNGLVQQLYLSELDLTDINQLIADTLHCSPAEAQPLAQLVQRKTGGNPFFMNEFLRSLYSENLIRFDYRSRQWQWLIDQIQEREITDNVVNLMAGKIEKLSDRAQHTLQIAASIGNQFDLDILALTSELSPRNIASSLDEAIAAGLIMPLSEAHKALKIGVTLTATESDIAYRFIHDRIQQAAYSLLSNDQKSWLHYKIGCLLGSKLQISCSLPSHRIEHDNEQIFTITSQLNLGNEQIKSTQERDRLAYLNLIAAKKARASYAYESAAAYTELGLQIVTNDIWQRQPQIILDLYLEAARAASLIGEFERVDQLVAVIFEQVTDVLERIKAVDIQIQSFIARNDLTMAIALALDSLQQLDVNIPAQPTPEIIASAFEQIRQQLATNEQISDLPPMTDAHKLTAINMLANMSSAAYIGAPALYPLIVLKQIELSLLYGTTPETAYAFSTYGLILCINGEIVKGNESADVAIALLEKFHALRFKAKIFNLVYYFVRPWQSHLRNTLEPLVEGYQAGLESGDTEFAAYCIYNHCQIAYFAGERLQKVNQDMQTYGEAIAKLNQTTALSFHQIGQQSALNWQIELSPANDFAYSPQHLIGSVYNINEGLPQHQAAGDQYSMGAANAHQLMLAYHFDQPETAVAIARRTEQTNAALGGSLLLVLSLFYHALALLAIAAHSPDQNSLLTEVAEDLAKLENWANHAPQNFAHKCDLIKAERWRVLGHPQEASDLYDRAIATAKEYEYIQEQALANELAAKFYFGLGKTFIAKAYMQEARYCYVEWGATAKIQHLEKSYRQILASTAIVKSSSKSISSRGSSSSRLQDLDLETIFKASHAIASEIHLAQLLTTLMNILIENAGAQTGYLLLPNTAANQSNQQQWYIEAIKTINHDGVLVMQSIPIDKITNNGSTYIPISLVNYVARTQETVVLDNAMEDGDFQNDPWVVHYQSKSLLCMPLLNQGTTIAIAILANNLVAEAFTQQRIQTLNLLSTQTAISISKARLLQQQAELNQSLQVEITNRKLAEKAKEAANEELYQLNQSLELRVKERTMQLEIANQELESFSYSVSHDLRAPLRAINGFSKILQDDYSDRLDSEGNRYLKIVRDNTKRMGELIEDLLNLSRWSRKEILRQPIAMNKLIQSILNDYKSEIERRNIQVIVADLPNCEADNSLLTQVLVNLISNAVKYTSKTDQPSIEIGSQIINDQSNQNVYFIRDNGAGFDMKYADKLFGVFQRMHLEKDFEGTGIGLAIVQRIIKKHGGKIWAEAAINQGATFYFTIQSLNS